MIIDARMVETQEAWYFPYGTVAFLAHREISSALAGKVPVKVPKDGTTLNYKTPAQR